MLTTLMANDPQIAKRQMRDISWKCCAGRTPVGRIYEHVARRVKQPVDTVQPHSWSSAMSKISLRLSNSFAENGLALTRSWFYLNGTGMALRDTNIWHCGMDTWIVVQSIECLT